MIYGFTFNNESSRNIWQIATPLLPAFAGYQLIRVDFYIEEYDHDNDNDNAAFKDSLVTQLPSRATSIIFFTLINYLDYEKFKLPRSHSNYGNDISVTAISQKIEKRTILKNVTFSVKKKQVFGLLGQNGAGKTTTFNILARQADPFNGFVEIQDEKTSVGLVPSFSPLHNDLSITQHLKLYGLVKGLSQQKIDKFIYFYSKMMNLEKISYKRSIFLSGGERRKLQLGIALIGGSSKLLMDEPTSGIDPVFRRQFQELIIQNCNLNSSSMIITTHSICEAEKICEVLGIIIRRKLKFTDTLKGFRYMYHNRVKISVCLKNSEEKEALRSVIKNTFQQHIEEIQESRNMYLSYLIGNDTIKLSQLFRFFQSGQVKQLIDDFEIQHATLDQIFKFYVLQQQIMESSLYYQPEQEGRGFLGSLFS